MTKLPSDDELRDAFWTGYAAASWGEKEVSGMRACAALAIARMNERATPPALHEAVDILRKLLTHGWAEDCQECAIGQSSAWADAKALIARVDAARRDGGE